jgi:hypothetical protein
MEHEPIRLLVHLLDPRDYQGGEIARNVFETLRAIPIIVKSRGMTMAILTMPGRLHKTWSSWFWVRSASGSVTLDFHRWSASMGSDFQ